MFTPFLCTSENKNLITFALHYHKVLQAEVATPLAKTVGNHIKIEKQLFSRKGRYANCLQIKKQLLVPLLLIITIMRNLLNVNIQCGSNVPVTLIQAYQKRTHFYK